MRHRLSCCRGLQRLPWRGLQGRERVGGRRANMVCRCGGCARCAPDVLVSQPLEPRLTMRGLDAMLHVHVCLVKVEQRPYARASIAASRRAEGCRRRAAAPVTARLTACWRRRELARLNRSLDQARPLSVRLPATAQRGPAQATMSFGHARPAWVRRLQGGEHSSAHRPRPPLSAMGPTQKLRPQIANLAGLCQRPG